jgi:hypothetical protein
MTKRVEGVGCTLYMDNFLSSQDVYNDLHTRGISCFENVTQNLKGMPGGGGFGRKTVKLKQGDIQAKVRGNLTAMIQKDKQDVHIY